MKTFRAFQPLFVPVLLVAPLFAQSPPATTPPSPFRLSTASGMPLTSEQEKEALEFLLSDANDRVESERQLHTTKTRSPEVYWAHLRSALSHKQQVAKLKAEDPQRYQLYQREQQLHRKVDLLTAQYRASKTDATREKARADLKAGLSELFDVREQVDCWRKLPVCSARSNKSRTGRPSDDRKKSRSSTRSSSASPPPPRPID